MWGEIEPCTGSTVSGGSSFEARDYASAREAADDDEKPKSTQKSRLIRPGNIFPVVNCPILDECPSALSNMIEAVAVSANPVKSQQLGEPDLTLEERRAVLLEQYRSKPLVFLERYQAHLKPEHLDAFAHLSADCRTQYYSDEVRRRATGQASKTSVKNHRYAALRALQQEGKYFSEEQMRGREPLLYEQYIGQYLNEDELAERSQGLLAGGAGGLADLLINSYQEQLLQRRLHWQQDKEEGAQEEDDEEDDEACEARGSEWEPTPEEKARLREEFVSQMHERFLEGKDEDFNYSEVDENPDYDNLDIVSRDAEERYFDEEEGKEEEEDDEEDEVAMD